VDLADAIHQARELQDQRRYDEAIGILLAAAEQHEDEDLWDEIASCYAERGFRRPDVLALADFDEADKWADVPATQFGRACVLARRGEFEAAEARLSVVLADDPEGPWGLWTLAYVRVQQKRFREAIETLAKVLTVSPRNPDAYALLASALRAEGKNELARKALTEGARQCPGHVGLLVPLARSYLEEGDFGTARRALEQAVALNPETAEAWRMLAWIAAREGDETNMRESLDKAVELDREATLAWIAKESLTLPELNAFGK
jgi:tetratricopeptide (TPR) repeat protein